MPKFIIQISFELTKFQVFQSPQQEKGGHETSHSDLVIHSSLRWDLEPQLFQIKTLGMNSIPIK